MTKSSTLNLPFREQSLLPISRFIKYANQRGITTNTAQLEYYERERLLLPAVRVFYPKRTKTISWGRDGWLKEHTVQFPSKTKFRPWKDYKNSEQALAFYSPLQVFTLHFVQSRMRVVIRDQQLFGSSADWIKTGEWVAVVFSNKTTLFKEIDKYNSVFPLIRQAQLLETDMVNYANESSSKHEVEFNMPEENSLYRDHFRVWRKKYLPSRANVVLKKYKIIPEQIRDQALWLARFGFSIDPVLILRTWLRDDFQKQKMRLTGEFRLAHDYYETAELLLWLFNGVTNKNLTLDDLYGLRNLAPARGKELCVICQKPFDPTPGRGGNTQVTCSKKCSKQNSKNRTYLIRRGKK